MVGSCAVSAFISAFLQFTPDCSHQGVYPPDLTPPHCSSANEVHERGCRQHTLLSTSLTTCISGVYLFAGCLPSRREILTLELFDSSGFSCGPLIAYLSLPTFDQSTGELIKTNQHPSFLAF